jgi:hypothetical protein
MATLSCPACNKTTFVVDESKCWTTYPGQYRATCSECGFVKKVFCGGSGEQTAYFLCMEDAVNYDRRNLRPKPEGSDSPPVYGGGKVTGFTNLPKKKRQFPQSIRTFSEVAVLKIALDDKYKESNDIDKAYTAGVYAGILWLLDPKGDDVLNRMIHTVLDRAINNLTQALEDN